MTTVDVAADLADRFAQIGAESLPAYERVKSLVTTQIRSGRWVAGDQLPSENQLVSTLGLSRMTINRAMRELAAEGIIARIMGVGTFVAGTKTTSALFEVKNIADEIAERGHRHSARVVRTGPVALAAAHGLFGPDIVGDTVFQSVVVHCEDGVPIQVEDRFVNPAEAPDYLEQDFTTTTPNTYLERVAPLVRGEHVVEAVLADPAECRLLEIDTGEPCLVIRRRTWSARGLVSAARLVHPGSRNRLEGSFTV